MKPIINHLNKDYPLGFNSLIASDTFPVGLNEDVIKAISLKKSEPSWLLNWRLKAFAHWQTMTPPQWGRIKHPPINFQAISYYSAPKALKPAGSEIDPEMLALYEKLGVPLRERKKLAGIEEIAEIAVDAVFDSVSVATTFKEALKKVGVIFCSFSEAVKEHPELVRQYLGSVVPPADNYYAALNSAVFSDGSFCFIPKGVRCPMELSTYFRINSANTGQFERTLIIAEAGAYVSYLEGCFVKGSLVFTARGWRCIEDIKIGEMVYDGNGEIVQVKALMTRPWNKQLLKIKMGFGRTIFLTPEHPVLTLPKNQRGAHVAPTYTQAKDITSEDYICIPMTIYQQAHLTTEFSAHQPASYTHQYYQHEWILTTAHTSTIESHKELVFNLETEGSHTFNVEGLSVHNCSAPARSENQLHAAVVELVAMDNAEIKYATVQNWYPGDKNGVGGVYNFVTKRGDARGYRSRISWTQIETGSAITWKYPSVTLRGDESKGEFYSIALTNGRQQADTGTKMIHLGENTTSIIVSKSISAGQSVATYRGEVIISARATHAKNNTQCDSLIFDQGQAHTEPTLSNFSATSIFEHEATTGKISEESLAYLQSRGINEENARNLMVNGFCKDVFKKLPAEFAVEAQRLLEVNMEGSIG